MRMEVKLPQQRQKLQQQKQGSSSRGQQGQQLHKDSCCSEQICHCISLSRSRNWSFSRSFQIIVQRPYSVTHDSADASRSHVLCPCEAALPHHVRLYCFAMWGCTALPCEAALPYHVRLHCLTMWGCTSSPCEAALSRPPCEVALPHHVRLHCLTMWGYTASPCEAALPHHVRLQFLTMWSCTVSPIMWGCIASPCEAALHHHVRLHCFTMWGCTASHRSQSHTGFLVNRDARTLITCLLSRAISQIRTSEGIELLTLRFQTRTLNLSTNLTFLVVSLAFIMLSVASIFTIYCLQST